jgi:hypothetical protein
MVTYLLAILEKGAVPFCCYDNPYYYSGAATELMPLATLRQTVRAARENALPVNFIYGRQPLPPAYGELIETVAHVKIIPPELQADYPDGLVVLDGDDEAVFATLPREERRTMILRIAPHNVTGLSRLFTALLGKFKRLNIHKVAEDHFTAAHLAAYEAELAKIGEVLAKEYPAGREVEVNLVSDRLLLDQMNNCHAGRQHVTVAPNGKCYICPGFYYDNEADCIGMLDEQVAAEFPNSRLLDMDRAPLCTRCDAFHCKRCVYLNKKTTGEFNVPSREQCVTAHMERETSRQLLNSLGMIAPFKDMNRIAALTYCDPLEKLERSRPGAVSGKADSGAGEDAMAQMLAMQKKILQLLQSK